MHQHAAQSCMGITPKVSQEVKSKHRRAQHAKVAIPALFFFFFLKTFYSKQCAAQINEG